MLYDKRALYLQISGKLDEFGLDNYFPADVLSILEQENVELHYCPFESPAIGAVLYKDKESAILVNDNKPEYDQRFDLAHELIHYWFHTEFTSFSLSDPASRDREKEWQANEGAAELLLPYRDFIPRFVECAKFAEENYEPPESIYETLSDHYKVNPVVVDYRIRNLESEILEYHSGIPIEKVAITRSNVRFDKDAEPVIYKSLIKRLISPS